MTEARGANGSGAFLKISVAVMGAVTLFSTGWAASSTMGLFDAKKIDERGTRKAQDLDMRLSVLEKTLEPRLVGIQLTLTAIQSQLNEHVQAPRQP